MTAIQATGSGTAPVHHGHHGHHGQGNRAEMMKKFDTNGDGKIDDSERAAARSEMKAKWAERHKDSGSGGGDVASSNREAVQSVSAGQYGAEGQAPAQQGQPTVDVMA